MSFVRDFVVRWKFGGGVNYTAAPNEYLANRCGWNAPMGAAGLRTVKLHSRLR
jgi:hypothetical protein